MTDATTEDRKLIEYLQPLHDKNLLWEGNGLRMRECLYGVMVYPAQDMYIGRSLDVYGEYMQTEVNLFKRLLQPGDVALDIGANIGGHAIPMARAVAGSGGVVVAVEPQRYCYNILAANVALNGLDNVHLLYNAMGDNKDFVQVPYVAPVKNINLGGSGIDFWEKKQSGDPVKCILLDDVQIVKCKLIKIDVEGMEAAVLRGGKNFITQHKPFLFVEDDNEHRRAELRGLLRELGYELYMMVSALYPKDNFFGVEEDVFAHQNVEPTSDKPTGCFNLVCVPAGQSLPEDLFGTSVTEHGFSIKKIEDK